MSKPLVNFFDIWNKCLCGSYFVQKDHMSGYFLDKLSGQLTSPFVYNAHTNWPLSFDQMTAESDKLKSKMVILFKTSLKSKQKLY